MTSFSLPMLTKICYWHRMNIEKAILFIQEAHAGQFDHAGKPYWNHCVEVMGLLPPEASEDAKLAALLHDVLEDTDVTSNKLRTAGFSERTIRIVELVTRTPDSGSYMDFIRSIVASGDEEAIMVKLSDNKTNSDPERIALITDPELRQRHEEMAAGRYARARNVLLRAA